MSENNKDRICLFAGTSEGRRLAAILKDAVDLTVCVATEYGQIMLDGIEESRSVQEGWKDLRWRLSSEAAALHA